MRLLKYKVNKFRSVKGTDWIEIDQWACFVGVNESGKTNLLLPLWKFNPADGATKIDLLFDYPRDEFSELDEENSVLKTEHFIETLFELDETEIERFEQLVVKYKQGQNSEDEPENSDASNSPEDIEEIKFTRHLLIKKDYNEEFYIHISNEECVLISDDLYHKIGKEAFQEICDTIPKIVYYSDYGNLDSDLYLPHVRSDLNRIDQLSGKERMKARTLKVLFGHLKLKPDDILKLGLEGNTNNNPASKSQSQIEEESRNKQERYAKLDSAGTRLTKQFREWWSQGDYIFNFNADGQYFRIFVSDNERPEKIELEARSKGLQWFFSFFLVFLAESEDNHKNCILLLDEPGLNLHPNAQADLIRFFNQLSDKNQLIYTTHLPFLVDHSNLDKVKAVYTENGLTLISNDLSKADKEKKAIQPVNAAIGISASQSLLVGCDIVLVEGISDQFYLTLIKNHLISKGLFKPVKEMVFIPVGGARSVKPVVSIILGSKGDLPYTLLDSDPTGKQFQTSLKNGFYSNEKEKVIETDSFTSKKGTEIEDLMPLDLIVDCFDRIYRTENGLEVSDLDAKKPIVPQLEKYAHENHYNLKEEFGWKVELSKKVKQKFRGDVLKKIEDSWVKLFQSFQETSE